MQKHQILARLMEKKTNCREWSFRHGYKPRTVYQLLDRYAGKSDLPRGRLSYRILRELSQEIGEEIVPGILATAA